MMKDDDDDDDDDDDEDDQVAASPLRTLDAAAILDRYSCVMQCLQENFSVNIRLCHVSDQTMCHCTTCMNTCTYGEGGGLTARQQQVAMRRRM